MQIDGMDYLQQPAIASRLQEVKSAKDDKTQLMAIMALFNEIRNASKSIVDEIGDGISITNLDEITAALHNETSKNTKMLLGALKGIQLSGEKQAQIIAKVNQESLSKMEDEFQTIRIKRPRDRVMVSNLQDFPVAEEVKVSNLNDLGEYFLNVEKAIKALKLNVDSPQIHVEAPIVNVPEQSLNIPPVDFEPLIDEIRDGFKKVRTNNNKSNPVFVRLTDLEQILNKLESIRSGQMTALSGFPNQMFIKGTDSNIINPAQQEQNTLKAFANIASGTTDGALVTAVAGKIIRVVALSAVAGGTATNLTFNSKPAGSGTAISPLYANGANGGEVLPYNPRGWFDTNAGEGLTATTGGGSTTGILVNYILA